jgi:hypothetical protein
LPNYLFEELKDLPDDQLSFRQSTYKLLNGKYTGLGKNVPPLAEVITNELTRNINTTLAVLQDEIQFAVQEGLGDIPHWTPVQIFGKLLRIVAFASGRIFVGRPLCRDEEWINMTINYTVDASNAVKEVLLINQYLRPFLVPWNRKILRAVDYRRKVAEKLRPQLDEMLEARKSHYVDDEYIDLERSNVEHSLATWSLVSTQL